MESRQKVRTNQYGQVMGPKGKNARSRLIAATVQLLAELPLRRVRVLDIAGRASMAPSTFYMYFSSVEDAVLAVIEGTNQSTPEILKVLERDWDEDPMGAATEFVEEYLSFWDRNYAVLRVRNLAADEGNARFSKERFRAARPILDGLSEKISAKQSAGAMPEDFSPLEGASVILAALERLAAAYRIDGGGATLSRSSLVSAMTHMIVRFVYGTSDP